MSVSSHITQNSREPLLQTSRIAVIGAGPAGLTLARMLDARGLRNVTLFEADQKIGGKCQSTQIGNHIVEFGTCYAILSHQYILKHMKALGIKRIRLKAQRIDDREMISYIFDGGGPNFLVQINQYLRHRARLLAPHDRDIDARNAELATPVSQWLQARKLFKIERMMHRVVSSLGYGYLDDLPLVHALRWVDRNMFLTGILKYTVMPAGGWQSFWDRFSEGLDVRLGQGVTQVDRAQDQVTLTLADGQRFSADCVINTIPLDRFCALTTPSEAEQKVADATVWSKYATSMMTVDRWQQGAAVNAWSETCVSDAHHGELLFCREECPDEHGKTLFTVGQYATRYTPEELAEVALFSARQKGAQNPVMVQQKIWQYAPSYAPESIKAGLLQTMKTMQGEARTFHTGSTFSHEAVSTISDFNMKLIAQMGL